MSSEIHEGDTVIVLGRGKWAQMGRWTVIKRNPQTYKLRHASGQILNAGHGLVAKVESTEDETKVHFPKRPDGLRVGAIVTSNTMVGTYEAGTPLVVIKDNFTSLNVVAVGGDPDHPMRYWSVPWEWLTVKKLGGGA